MTAEKPVTLADTAENPAALSSLLLRAWIIAGMNRKELKWVVARQHCVWIPACGISHRWWSNAPPA